MISAGLAGIATPPRQMTAWPDPQALLLDDELGG